MSGVVKGAALLCVCSGMLTARLYGSDYGPPGEPGVLTTQGACCRQRGQEEVVMCITSGCACRHKDNQKDPLMGTLCSPHGGCRDLQNKMLVVNASAYILIRSRVPYGHFYNMCHIMFILQAYDLIFIPGGGRKLN